MRNETAEAKKGTWKGGRRCTQAKGTERRQSQGQSPPCKGGAGIMYIESCGCQPIQGGAGRSREDGRKGKKGEVGWGSQL